MTGELVYEAGTAVAMAMRHVEGGAVPPSQRTELEVPPELDALILDCLARDREARPASAAAVARRLDRVALATPWTPQRAEQWWSAHLPEDASEG